MRSSGDILQMLSLASLSFISFGTFLKSGLIAAATLRTEDWVTGRSHEMRCEGGKVSHLQRYLLFLFETFHQIFLSCCDMAGKVGREEILTFHGLTSRK